MKKKEKTKDPIQKISTRQNLDQIEYPNQNQDLYQIEKQHHLKSQDHIKKRIREKS